MAETKEEGKNGFWSGLNPYVKLAIIVIAVIIVLVIVKKLWDNYEAKKKQKILEQSIATTTVAGSNGQQIPLSVNLGTKASAIYNAFYDNDWFGWSEDESAAVRELLDVPKSLIGNLSTTYTAYGAANGKNVSLKEDFQKYCASEWPKISYLFS